MTMILSNYCDRPGKTRRLKWMIQIVQGNVVYTCWIKNLIQKETGLVEPIIIPQSKLGTTRDQ